MANIIVPQGKALANYGDQAATLGPQVLRIPSNAPNGTVISPVLNYTGSQPPQFHPRNSGIDVVAVGDGTWNLVAAPNRVPVVFGVLSAPGVNSVECIAWVGAAYTAPGLISGSVIGTGNLLGIMTNTGNNLLSGTILGTGVIVGALANNPPGVVALSGVTTGAGIISGTLVNRSNNFMSGLVNGVGFVAGTLTNGTAAQYLGPVATAGRSASNATQASSNTSTQYMAAKTRHYIRGASPSQIVFAVPGGVGASFNSLAASVTYGLTVTDTAGVDHAVTWSNGSPTGACAPGTILYSDPVSGTFTKDSVIFGEWNATTPPGGQFPTTSLIKDTANGETFAVSNSPISGYTDDGSNVGFYPTAILGMTSQPTVLLMGTSRMESYFDTQDGTSLMGCAERWTGDIYGIINLGIGGLTAPAYNSTSDPRRQLAKYCSTAVLESGINDLLSGVSDTTLRSYLLATKTNYSDTPSWIRQTMTPVTDSASGFTTPGDQTAGPPATDRTQYFSTTGPDPRKTNNAWGRAIPAGFVGVVDTSTQLETAQDSGVWLVPGYTGDGVHETMKANQAAASGVRSTAHALIANTFVKPNSLGINGANSSVGTPTTNPLAGSVAGSGAVSGTLTNAATSNPLSGTVSGSGGPTGTLSNAAPGVNWRTSLGSALLAEYDVSSASNIVTSGSTVTQILDITGNGRHLFVNNSGSIPTYSSTGSPSGKPCVTFPSGAIARTGSAGSSAAPYTLPIIGSVGAMAMVASKSANAQYQRMMDYLTKAANDYSDPANAIYAYDNGDGTVGMANNGLGSSTIAYTNTTEHVLLSQFTSSGSELYVDGLAVVKNAATPNFPTNGAASFMGQLPNTGGPTGTFSAGIIASRDLTTAERTAYFAEMKTKWGTP